MGTAKVEIFGEKYTLRADADTDYIVRVAQYVDHKFAEVARYSPTLSPAKMAILTSLNIADELIKSEEEKRQLEASITRKLGELISLVEQGMQEAL
jgi:cell division protein ZapA